MRRVAAILLAVLALGCTSPAMDEAPDGLVEAFPAGTHEVEGLSIVVHQDAEAVHAALRDRHPDNPVIVINEAAGVRAHAWTSLDGDEVHVPAPGLDIDPVWLCVLGHEIAHAATGAWHPPGVDIGESCAALTVGTGSL